MTPSDQGDHETGPFAGGPAVLVPVARIPKERRSCCSAARDALGRWPVGFCGPDCEGRTLYPADDPRVAKETP